MKKLIEYLVRESDVEFVIDTKDIADINEDIYYVTIKKSSRFTISTDEFVINFKDRKYTIPYNKIVHVRSDIADIILWGNFPPKLTIDIIVRDRIKTVDFLVGKKKPGYLRVVK